MKKPLINILVINLFILLIYFLCGLLNLLINLLKQELYIINFVYFSLAVFFLAYIINHTAYKRQRIQLVIISSLIILFMVFRALKYISLSHIDIISRHLWYLYYLPIIFMPYFLLVASLSPYYDSHKKMVLPIYIIAGLISLILFILILTNDIHQWAFIFNDDFLSWDSDYHYGIIYYITIGYIGLLFLASFICFFRQSRITKDRRLAFASLIPLLLGLLWIVLDFFNLRPYVNGISVLLYFPEILCFMVAGYVINLFALNLITSNNGYAEIFSKMSLPAMIRDTSDQIIYSNSESLLNIKDSQIIIDNHLYKNVMISGGRITWISDISSLLEVNKELSEINERLKEEEQLHKLENALKEEQLAINEKDKLYDEIAKDVLNESNRIITLSKEIREDSSLFEKNMPIILLLSIYIKRFANLKLLLKEKSEIDNNELYLSLNETFRYLEKMDVKTLVVGKAKGAFSSQIIFDIYSFIGNAILSNLKDIKGITAFLNDGYLIKITVEAESLIINEELLKDIDYTIEKEDEVYYMTFIGGKNL